MTHLVESPWAESARAVKVERLASFLASHLDLSADDAGAMIEGLGHRDLKWWTDIAAACSQTIGHNVNPPSVESVSHIQAELRKRIPDDSDPFDLPSTPADRIATP